MPQIWALDWIIFQKFPAAVVCCIIIIIIINSNQEQYQKDMDPIHSSNDSAGEGESQLNNNLPPETLIAIIVDDPIKAKQNAKISTVNLDQVKEAARYLKISVNHRGKSEMVDDIVSVWEKQQARLAGGSSIPTLPVRLPSTSSVNRGTKRSLEGGESDSDIEDMVITSTANAPVKPPAKASSYLSITELLHLYKEEREIMREMEELEFRPNFDPNNPTTRYALLTEQLNNLKVLAGKK